MKKVLLITDTYPTQSFKRSGIFAYDDYNYLTNNGYEVFITIIFRKEFNRSMLFSPIKQIALVKKQLSEIRETIKDKRNIELITYFSFIKPFVFKEDLLLLSRSNFTAIDFHVIIVHKMLHVGLNINWIKRQFPNSKIVLKEHSDWTLHSKLVQYFQLLKVRYYDEIWTNSLSTKSMLLELFKLNTGTVKKQPKIDIDYPKFHINNNIILKSNNRKILKILTVANLIKEKGYEEAFEVIKIINEYFDWEWTIIGKGNFLESILELAKRHNFLGKIKIIEEQEKSLLHDSYKYSDIYLQLSYMETFGIAPIEAFSFYNKLIVSKNITSINELGLIKNNNIFIIEDLNNIKVLKEKLKKFIMEKSDEKEFESGIKLINDEINKILI